MICNYVVFTTHQVFFDPICLNSIKIRNKLYILIQIYKKLVSIILTQNEATNH